MGEFKYENQGSNTYLVYEVGENENIDSMSLGMITNNSVPGLAKTMCIQMDANKYIKFNVSSKVSARQIFSGVVNKSRLLGVLDGIASAMLSAEEYMIEPNMIELNLDYVFTDVSSCETVLICVPIEEKKQEQDIGIFIKNILFNLQFDPSEDYSCVARLMNYLNSTPVFVISDFKKLIDELKNGNISVKKVEKKIEETINVKKVVEPVENVKPKIDVKPSSMTPQPYVTPTASPIIKEQREIGEKIQPQIVKQPNNTEKKIGVFDLLMHYSKENVELYKSQKTGVKTSKEKKPKIAVSGKSYGYAPGFAVPGVADTPNNDFRKPVDSNSQKQVNKVDLTESDTVPKIDPNSINHKLTPPVLVNDDLKSKPMSFGETTVLNAGKAGETTVLNGEITQSQPQMPYLIRQKNNEKIALNKPIFRIGKEKSYVDYFIGDNTAISRSHANIITREGSYFITDTNSTNHTFVNGGMIQSNTEFEIHSGDTIRLANEEFEFKLY